MTNKVIEPKTETKVFLISVFICLSIIIGTILSWIIFDSPDKRENDYYSAIIYSIIYLYLIISAFYLIKKGKTDVSTYVFYFISLIILNYSGYETFFIYKKTGIILFLIIQFFSITLVLSLIICISFLIQKKHDNNIDFINDIISQPAIIYCLVFIGISYYPIKETFCQEFGVKEIGNYFEKGKYKSEYYLKLHKITDEDDEPHITDYEVSEYDMFHKLSKQYWLDKEFIVPAVIGIIKNENKVLILEPIIVDGESIDFKFCLPSKDPSDGYECFCEDQNGTSWRVEMTGKKVK